MAKIMIVDDSLFIRNRLSKLLAEHGYETVVARDGKEAVDTYRSAKPDAVLMDVTMPNKNGLEALNEIRQFDSRARVIMLTALDQRSVATQAIQKGAKDFLVKPIRSDQVTEALRRILRCRP
jgi:two-component system chemotaxis response regulator CheY